MSTLSKAKTELDILSKSITDPNNRPVVEFFTSEILSLCKRFGESGQSGGSAPYTARILSQTIEKLLLQESISPIMGIDDEWYCHNQPDMKYQNMRCPALFKKSDDNKDAYYLDAIVWKITKSVNDNIGYTYTGEALYNGKKVYSRQYVNGFPFEPKTFYVEIEEKEDGARIVIDPKQMEEVYNYYRHPDYIRINRNNNIQEIVGNSSI